MKRSNLRESGISNAGFAMAGQRTSLAVTSSACVCVLLAAWFGFLGMTPKMDWFSTSNENELGAAKSFMPFVQEPQYYNLTEEVLRRLGLYNKLRDVGLIPRDAVGAAQRATDACKPELLRLARRAVDGTLHPLVLPSFCPSPGRERGKFMGCFQDGRSRFLNDTHVVLKTENTPEACVDYCRVGGFSFAGVQYSKECWCGKHFPDNPVPLPTERCDMACSGDPSRTCGGFYTVAVYDTGTNGVPHSDEKVAGEDEDEEVGAGAPTSNSSSAAEKSPARLAFLVTVHGRNYRQVARLLRNVYGAQHFYYVHVDAASDYLYRRLKILNDSSNIYVVPPPQRQAPIWGGASLLSVALEAFAKILELFPEVDFVLNMSESDFPLRKLDDLVAHLGANRGKNFLRSHGSLPHEFFTKQGLNYVFVECGRRMWNVGKERLVSGVTFDGGSDWFLLSGQFVRYVVSEGNSLGEGELFRGLRQYFKYKLLPVESFFHTLLANSALCPTRINAHLRGINWQRKKSCGCRSKRTVDWCGCSPSIYRLEDLDRLRHFGARRVFLGRKFDSTVDLAVVNELETEVLGNRPEGVDDQVYESQWENVFDSESGDDLKVTGAGRDSIRSLYEALGELALASVVGSTSSVPEIPGSRLLSVDDYFVRDEWMGYVVRMALEGGNEDDGNRVEIEALIVRRLDTRRFPFFDDGAVNTFLTGNDVCDFAYLLKDGFVTTDVEPKDGVWRNAAEDFGSDSEPWIVTRWHSSIVDAYPLAGTSSSGGVGGGSEDGQAHDDDDDNDGEAERAGASNRDSVLAVLVDSHGVARHEINVTLKADNKRNEDLFTFTEFPENLKLSPGVWSVALAYPHAKCLVGADRFVVLPDRKTRLSEADGAVDAVVTTRSWVNYASLAADRAELERVERQLLSSPEKFVFHVAEKKYKMADWCCVSAACLASELNTPCQDELWSTFTTDHKSDVSFAIK